jgi:hypothetical protein
MNSLSKNQLKTLIQLESEGKVTPKEIYKRCALAKVQQQDNYVSTAIVHVIVGVMLVGFAGQLIIPVVGASWLYTWMKAYRTRQESIRHINGGHIADYLDPDDRVSFEEDMKALETVAAVAVPTDSVAQSLPIAPVPQTSTGRATLAVSAQQRADFHQPSPVIQVAPEDSAIIDLSENSPIPNVAEDLGRHPYPALIIGIPGSGKGILHSNAIAALARFNPKYQRFGVDPKNDPKEDGYWERYHKTHRRRIDTLTPEQVAAWVDVVLDDWAKVSAPKVMVWDEFALTAKMLDACKEKTVYNRFQFTMTALVSNGHSREEIIWAVSQNAHCVNLGFDGGQRSNFRAIALVASHNIASVSSLTSTTFVGKISDGSLSALMRQSPCSRAVFDGKANQWFPMPQLENFSSWNRDTRSVIAKSSTREAQIASLERAVGQSNPLTGTTTKEDRFSRLLDKLTSDSQADLRSFVEWLSKRQSQEITSTQIKDNWARNHAATRSKEYIVGLIAIAKAQKLITVLSEDKCRVNAG